MWLTENWTASFILSRRNYGYEGKVWIVETTDAMRDTTLLLVTMKLPVKNDVNVQSST
jgi:hypothetical protein